MARGGPLSRPRIPFRHPFRDEASKEHAVILERRSPNPTWRDGPGHASLMGQGWVEV